LPQQRERLSMEKVKELAKFFFTDITGTLDKASTPEKLAVIKQIEQSKLDITLLKEIMIDYKHLSKTDITSFAYILNAYKNSILQDRFYYHPYLQVSSSAPVIKQNADGEFEEYYTEPFFLRNIRIFTIKNLIDYFYVKNGTHSFSATRDKSTAELFLRACESDLDLALFTIDVGISLNKDQKKEPAPTMIHLTDYIPEGRKMLFDRVSNSGAVGLTHEY
jgi:hypothetical protein